LLQPLYTLTGLGDDSAVAENTFNLYYPLSVVQLAKAAAEAAGVKDGSGAGQRLSMTCCLVGLTTQPSGSRRPAQEGGAGVARAGAVGSVIAVPRVGRGMREGSQSRRRAQERKGRQAKSSGEMRKVLAQVQETMGWRLLRVVKAPVLEETSQKKEIMKGARSPGDHASSVVVRSAAGTREAGAGVVMRTMRMRMGVMLTWT
jgi:hypothetical protein